MESKLQTRIKNHLRKDGWEVIKTVVLSESGYEDLFCFKDGKTMFIEAKDNHKKPRPLQAYRIKTHNKNGFYSFFANSWKMFLENYTGSQADPQQNEQPE